MQRSVRADPRLQQRAGISQEDLAHLERDAPDAISGDRAGRAERQLREPEAACPRPGGRALELLERAERHECPERPDVGEARRLPIVDLRTTATTRSPGSRTARRERRAERAPSRADVRSPARARRGAVRRPPRVARARPRARASGASARGESTAPARVSPTTRPAHRRPARKLRPLEQRRPRQLLPRPRDRAAVEPRIARIAGRDTAPLPPVPALIVLVRRPISVFENSVPRRMAGPLASRTRAARPRRPGLPRHAAASRRRTSPHAERDAPDLPRRDRARRAERRATRTCCGSPARSTSPASELLARAEEHERLNSRPRS